MKTAIFSFQRNITTLLLSLVAYTGVVNKAAAQCATGVAPTYTKTCSVEYYQSITATGLGVFSTISVSGITSCTSTYINDFATQGITTAAGNTVTVNITRPTGYTAYLSIYVDWNNNGTFDLSELCGAMVTIPLSSASATYTFSVPTTGIVTGVNLPMRFFLSEDITGPPCNGTYGQTYDFYFKATCPPTAITVSPIKDSICLGGFGDTITASGAGIGGMYTWAPSTGLSATTGAVVIATPTVVTTYTVTGTTSIGCSGSDTELITIHAGPTAPNDTALGVTKFCNGGNVQLKDTINLAGYKYQWYNGTTVIAGATDTSYTASKSGSYTIGLIDTLSGCMSLSKPIVVTAIIVNPSILFDGKVFRTEKYYKTYQWYENKVLISGATFDSVIAHTNGNYQVKVTDTNGCQDTSITYTLKRLDVNSTITSSIRIYPNPASSVIHIDAPIRINAIVTSIDGKIMLEQQDAKEINIGSLSNGMYFVELFDETGQRLIIQKLVKN